MDVVANWPRLALEEGGLMREVEVEARLVRAVEKRGGQAYKWASPARRGVPDRLCILPGGVVVAVECKRPGATPTPLQARELDRLAALGITARVVDSPAAVEGLMSLIDEMMRG